MTNYLYTPTAVPVGTIDGIDIIDAAHNVAIGLGFDIEGRAPRLDTFFNEDRVEFVEVYDRHDGSLVAQLAVREV
jgi:hypothetical protein